MKPILVLDCNFLAYQALHTTGCLSTSGDDPSGVTYGFLNRIVSLAEQFHTPRLVFCWDGGNSIRKKRYAWYKLRDAEETPAEKEARKLACQQFNTLATYTLPSLGFGNVFCFEGYEGDDVIASIVNEWTGDKVIVSSDEDMFQLLSEGSCRMYNPTKRRMITKQTFMEEFGIHPVEWITVKKIAGCHSDKVPGVRGVGEKTALKYIRGELKANSKAHQDITCAAGVATAVRNHWLVELPLPDCPVPQEQKDHFNLGEWKRVCSSLEFHSLTSPEYMEKLRRCFLSTPTVNVCGVRGFSGLRKGVGNV